MLINIWLCLQHIQNLCYTPLRSEVAAPIARQMLNDHDEATMHKNEATPRQIEVFNAIVELRAQSGRNPSYAELARRVGTNGKPLRPVAIRRHVSELTRKGLLAERPAYARRRIEPIGRIAA